MITSSNSLSECASKLNRRARENPKRSLLVAVGLGLAVGVLVHTLRARRPENRAARLLTDMRNRLNGIVVPVQRQADHLVKSGASAIRSGVAHFHDLQIEPGLKKLGQRSKNIFR